ncbi:MAG: cobalamin B12-binding/radical SAM domain-containing protein, partial [Pygmaiobacter sp.]
MSGREDHLRCFALEPAFHALEQLAQSGTKTIKFIDRTFNANEPRALTIWKFLVQRNAEGAFLPGICFHFEVAADLFSADCLAFLKTVPRGLFQFEAGLQSFHTETLAAVQRKTDTEHLCQNLRSILAGDNIHLHIDLIAGLPHENLETFADSFDRAFALGAHQLQLGFLKLIYGSALRRDAALYDLAATCNAPYEVISTRWLTPVDFSVLAFAEQSLGRLFNSGRYVR